jgi:hypothetical protein
VGLYGLSFLMEHEDRRIYKHFSYEAGNPAAITGFLEKWARDWEEFRRLERPVLYHHNDLNLFVPSEIYRPGEEKNLLDYNVKILPGDTFSADMALPGGVVNVYVPFENVNNFFLEFFDEVEFYHSASPFYAYAQKLHNASRTEIFVRLMEKEFQYLILDKGNFMFFNTFRMENTDDFLYYFFFVWEETGMNARKPGIFLLGPDDKIPSVQEALKDFSNGIRHLSGTEPEILSYFL